MCGGTPGNWAGGMSAGGLSPRVRGNLPYGPHRGIVRRSIPACAGEPRAYRHAAAPGQVYPRVCGGTADAPRLPLIPLGLSPRVRGNPAKPRASAWPCWVYPRVCGGTAPEAAGVARPPGLSPRVRGNPVVAGGRRYGLRSIPACAGEPTAAPAGHCGSTVYPRVCGGTLLAPARPILEGGLSPRVRGNRIPCRIASAGAGSIPACAGEPRPGGAGRRRCWVYPRVCGGTYALLIETESANGLSPRVRGNHRHRSHPGALGGSIPACAGEPSQ